MSDQKNADVARKLALLKTRFREKALSELELLETAMSGVRAAGIDSGEVVAAYQSLHRLAGSAGTFGYDRLGKSARDLEQILKPYIEGDHSSRSEILHLLNDDFMQRVGSLSALLCEGDIEPSWPVAPPEKGVKGVAEPVVLVVEPDSVKAAELSGALATHGFAVYGFPDTHSLPDKTLATASVVLMRDTLFVSEGAGLSAKDECPPIVCVGSVDGFPERYRLADLGADGFVCEPLDVPVLADYIERLISERLDVGAGRVIIVDDDAELLEHYSLVLEEGGMAVRKVQSPSELPGALSEFRPDIILMDVQMGSYSGTTLARMLRFDPEWVGLHIIFLSSEEDRDFQVDALSKGGDDFLTKPVSDDFLLRAARVRCYRARQLDKLASRDSLTGLLKHSLVKQEVIKEHARCRRLSQKSVVAMLDLDHFKRVNDTYGHRTGDLVIKGLANLLRHRLRKTDVIGRYGGEEFLVVLPDCSIGDALRTLQTVCEQMNRIGFSSRGEEFHVTVSIGMATLETFDRGEDAIEAADQALYRRKSAGRNGVTVFGAGQTDGTGREAV
ncbi:diguanylate cyclase [Marinobacter salinexigens]|uniref:diguanylate cyclase n=1 Tax=Marinobacter salinexigens TaxID=2919747 RepID=A0A5B0V9X0_9GAMM|nr:diguanylate cyclase [Marinobacter salinexigens]KAA1171452.1 diguanylate cyclase [Marinobacter salinexigens]